MNSYGDPHSARARAQVPGPSGAPVPDDDPPAGRADYLNPDAVVRRPRGSASVGSAAVGSASVGSAAVPGVAGRAPVGRASVGSAPVAGRAGVGEPGPVGYRDSYRAPGGTGRAAVARAAVRPVSPGAPGDLTTGGGAGGDLAGKRAKRRRRANIMTAAGAVLIILLGSGVVGFTWFYDGVDYLAPAEENQVTVVLAADGKTPIVKRGEQRINVPYNKINPHVTNAVMAAEDKNFLDHNGIDLKGIARAAWNNFTGGDTQGASTITQQYARHLADDKEISYNRKLREAVLARKLEANKEKPEILGAYLNAIYFGRGAHGVEAAARAYFNKSVLDMPPSKKALTVSEAAVLASVIKQPEPVPGGHQGYDPENNLEAAQERWRYTLGNMREMGWISDADLAAATYPKVREPQKGGCAECMGGSQASKIWNHVKYELFQMGITQEQLNRGGYEIKTTIDPAVQKAAEAAASRSSKSSPLYKRPKTYESALVALDTSNSRVLGYYGGSDPTGYDFAGGQRDAQGRLTAGGLSPGSSFKIYTLAAGLKDEISFQTRWDSTLPKKNGKPINNAGRQITACPPKSCTLEVATIQSYNFPFYWIADAVGPGKVLKAAKDAGLRYVLNNDDEIVDLASTDASTLDRKFDREVGFGQYRVLPLEHANGVATLANRGVYNKVHFVTEVKKRDPATGKMKTIGGEKLKPDQRFPEEQMDDLNGVLQRIPFNTRAGGLNGGRPATAKTGTWQYDNPDKRKKGNGDVWVVGATPQISAVVWVGAKGNRFALKERDGRDMGSSGTPAFIWKKFMDAAHQAKNLPVERFPDRKVTGRADHEAANGQAVQQCDNFLGLFCPPNNGNNNGGNNGGNNNGGDNNGPPGLPTFPTNPGNGNQNPTPGLPPPDDPGNPGDGNPGGPGDDDPDPGDGDGFPGRGGGGG